jgi:8-oxo-dGTP diphosphatase
MSPANPTQLLPLVVVAAALTRADGRILVQQRPADKHHGGLWEFPGGKVEPGETLEAALIRELGEELGILVSRTALKPLAFASEPDGPRPLLLLLYRVTSWLGEPRAVEAPAIRWVRPAELGALSMPPADAPFVVLLGHGSAYGLPSVPDAKP